ncbi:MAG TPA: hypothetical protein VMV69_15060 [Pirellulales bacterium]|nr:hypothetical protein [Pirellulales bacterium]
MARRRGAPASSLDLLLDTICNTFGGVLFLAILTVILLQMSGREAENASPEVPRQAELAGLELRREDLAARLKTLRAAADQQDALREQLAPADERELAATLRQLRARRDAVDQRRLTLLGEVSQAQLEINTVSMKLAELDRVLSEDREKLAAAEDALRREVADRGADAGLPVLHDTNKDEIPLLLSAGHLHLVYRLNPDGSVVFNQDDCQLTTSNGQREVSAKPGKGMPIEADGASRQALTAKLAAFEKEDYYLAVFVWPDSFAHFRELKAVMVGQGYEYRLVPLPQGEKVYMGATSNVPVKVQ